MELRNYLVGIVDSVIIADFSFGLYIGRMRSEKVQKDY